MRRPGSDLPRQLAGRDRLASDRARLQRSDRDRHAAVDRERQPRDTAETDERCTPTRSSISTATGCARNAACSASSAIPTPPPSPRSACTRCSTAARKPPASSRFDGKRFHSERRMGLVGDNFSRREVIDRLPGTSAIGHVRYSTTGETILRNVQPLFAELDGGGFAVGHNGNLTNGLTLRRQLVREGAMMQSTTDTEVILHLVARVADATASSTASSKACASSKAPIPSSA